MSSIASILQRPVASAPTRKERPKLDWETMDVATLPDEMQTAFRELLAIQEAERRTRKALSDAIAVKLDLPSHLTIRIACQWGKLSVAIDRAPTSGSATLADLAKRVDKQ